MPPVQNEPRAIPPELLAAANATPNKPQEDAQFTCAELAPEGDDVNFASFELLELETSFFVKTTKEDTGC